VGVLGWIIVALASWIAMNLGVFVLLLLRSNSSQRKRTQPKPALEAGRWALCALAGGAPPRSWSEGD
jgi:hypothetical protein